MNDLVAVLSAAVKVTQGTVSKRRLVRFKTLKGILTPVCACFRSHRSYVLFKKTKTLKSVMLLMKFIVFSPLQ